MHLSLATGSIFRYYLGLVGVVNGIIVDPAVDSVPVVFPGWDGNCWDQTKKMTAAQQVEVTLASNYIVLRPIRGRVAINYRDNDVSWAINDVNIAQQVEVFYYNSQQKTNSLVYPLGGWTDQTPVYAGLAAGSVTKVNIALIPDDVITLGASLTSVQQPVAVDSVDRDYDTSSVYAIVGNDGLPYLASEWAANGGKVEVAIGADTRSLDLTITASRETQYAPYQLAMASGTSDSYSSLRIVGSGVFFDRQKLVFDTGNSADVAPTVVGATVDSEFIQTRDQAYHVGLWAGARWTGPQQTITINTSGINRLGDNGNYRYPVVEEFNAEFAGMTVADFNAAWVGEVVANFNAHELALVSADFDNQAFGNVAGARVLHDGQWYRIRTVPGIGPASLTYTAERDTIVSDFNTVYAGMTVADFNTEHAGKTTGGWGLSPLSLNVS